MRLHRCGITRSSGWHARTQAQVDTREDVLMGHNIRHGNKLRMPKQIRLAQRPQQHLERRQTSWFHSFNCYNHTIDNVTLLTVNRIIAVRST